MAQLGPIRGTIRTVMYWIIATSTTYIYMLIFRTRAYHRERTPMEGTLLIAANHQSYLDPPCLGSFARRRLSYIAQSGLFKFKPLGWMLEIVGSVAINQEAGDAGAIREVLRRLGEGAAVLIFPEGTRCTHGEMEDFKRGVAVLVKRAKCPVQPAAIHGAFDAWPRHKRFPRIFGQRVSVIYGYPIPYDELMKDGADAALERLKKEITALQIELKELMQRG